MRKDFHYFEHSGDAASAGLGSHTMVIADHNGSFRPNAQAEIAFAEPGATMRQDSLDRWRSEVRLQTNAIELGSWNYRSLGMRPVQAASGIALHQHLHPQRRPALRIVAMVSLGALRLAIKEYGEQDGARPAASFLQEAFDHLKAEV